MQQMLSSDKRIAKNTLLLYTRTIFVMVVSLYTSRVVLATLGIDDYGIYNVVGGVVAMFGMVSGSLSSAISRFITFELGRGDMERLKRIFSTSVNIQLIISLLVLFLGETVGLWFVNNKLNIPFERLATANLVLHCSLITFIINIISTPYNAVIISHERMSIFAYISMLEVCLKLGIVYLLGVSSWDKLKTYAVLLVVVAICIRLVYGIYCRNHFEEAKYQFLYDRELIKEMFCFGGWMFLGATAQVFSTQGTNILLNIFYGIAINAAAGIGNQVNSAVNQFVSNFQTAFTPQIVKLYAVGDLPKLRRLLYQSSRFSFLLLFAIAYPLMLNVDFILALWLKDVPAHTSAFCILILTYSLVEALSRPVGIIIHATGRVKKYNIFMSIALSMNLILSFIFLKLGFPPEIVMVIGILVCIICFLIRLLLAQAYHVVEISRYVRNVLLRSFFVVSVAFPIPFFLGWNSNRWSALGLTTLSFLPILAIATYFIGLTHSEREKIRLFLMRRVHFIWK